MRIRQRPSDTLEFAESRRRLGKEPEGSWSQIQARREGIGSENQVAFKRADQLPGALGVKSSHRMRRRSGRD